MTPEERVMRAKIAGLTRWAEERDRTGATAVARRVFMDRFTREEEAHLPPEERAKREQTRRTLYFTKLRYAGIKKQRRAS